MRKYLCCFFSYERVNSDSDIPMEGKQPLNLNAKSSSASSKATAMGDYVDRERIEKTAVSVFFKLIKQIYSPKISFDLSDAHYFTIRTAVVDALKGNKIFFGYLKNLSLKNGLNTDKTFDELSKKLGSNWLSCLENKNADCSTPALVAKKIEGIAASVNDAVAESKDEEAKVEVSNSM